MIYLYFQALARASGGIAGLSTYTKDFLRFLEWTKDSWYTPEGKWKLTQYNDQYDLWWDFS